MTCTLCHRQIKRAYYTACGRAYGPTCGAKLGLGMPVATSTAKRTRVRKPPRAVVQDGQIQLFEDMAA